MALFGLATFTTEQRTKEIGVRKVLGTSVDNIVGLLSKDFLKLVLIAAPVDWFATNQWLASFAYWVVVYWRVFRLAGLLAVNIALLTVSFQSIIAALLYPVKSLQRD